MAGVRGVAALGRLVAGGPADADAVLLARFAEAGDEAAFAALVKRHGPLVAAVCRRHLRQPADVDDAVQATFLVLARKAGSVHTAVGPWLYRVAERTAAKLRRAVRHVEPLPGRPGGLPADVRAVVADELGRLPERYRMVVELCYVAGHSTAEAAARLGWPKGTVLTRLAWARRRLRASLTRRGVTLGGSLAAGLLDRSASGVGPRAVKLGAGEAAGRVLSLCDGVIRAMTLTKLGLAAGLTAVAVAATGTAVGPWAAGQPPQLPAVSTRKAEPPLQLPPPADPPRAELPPAKPPELPQLELPRFSPADPPKLPPPTKPSEPVFTPPSDPPPAKPAGKTYTVAHPAGSFVREFADGERFAVRFEDDRLYFEASFGDKAKPMTVSLDADYAMNKEGVVFGVVTGFDSEGPDETLFGGLNTHWLGEPFALRLRSDDGAVSIKDVRFGGVRLQPGQDEFATRVLTAVAGRYVSSKEPVATARKAGKPRLPKLRPGDSGLVRESRDSIPLTQPAAAGPIPPQTLPTGPERSHPPRPE